ncbi:uncharacterized protein LOC141910949 isoform X2 [Tubulanus polymorphus]|uniref:uncharacterized protein LOC141910949 isoform X2 n=1 Tax=Tubulanus polymorphus TaxID=672921 RepID=UPI003DA27A19
MIFGMIDRFYIHANYVRIYVVTFGGNNYLKAISITGQSSIAYLNNLRPVTGTPDLGLVLQYVTTRIFQNTQYVRTDAKNNLFLLTSGVTNLQNVVILNQYINILHSMNIYMPVFYVPGASGVQMSVLNDIAYPTPITTVTTSTTVTQITTIVTTTITYISKTMSCNRGYVYVAQRNRCEDINECASPVKPCLGGTCANTAGSFTCSCAPSLQFVAGAGCVNKKQTDVVIAIDSSVPTDKLNKLKQYAIGFVERQFVDPNVIRVAIVDFSSSVRIQQTLKQTTNLDSTLTKIQQISRRTGTPNLLSLLQTLQNSILKSTNGFRPAAKTLVLILSGGSSVPNQGTTVKTVVNNIKETTGAVIPIITTGPISSGNRPMFDEISWPMRSNDVTTKPVTTTSIITTVTTIVTDVVQTLNCQKGYQAVNGKCVDINECSRNPCNRFQKCVNKNGGYSCDDINECARKPSPCQSVYEKCVNKPGGYTCVDINECNANPCNAKYQKCVNKVHGHNCVDIDECTEKRHNCNLKVATCVNKSPSFECVDINECKENPCQSYETCVNKNPGYSCVAIKGCDVKPCKGSMAKCVNKPRSAERTCNCNPGFNYDENTGCVDIDECKKNPCKSYETCVNKNPGYSCVAIKGCDVKPCKGSMVKCVNKPRSAERTCNCNPGFNYDENTGCVDINECARKPSPCHGVYEKCVNKPGGYTCVDINECSANPCNAKYQKCVNKVHGHNCVDIDECTENRHNCNLKVATCINESPGFKCVDIDECKKNPCKSYETCVNKNPGYSCVAIKGCDVKPCKGSMAKCVNKPRSAERTCNCNPGFNYDENTGCVDVDECKTLKVPCKGMPTSTCHNTPGSHTCKCPTSFKYDAQIGCLATKKIDIAIVVDVTSAPNVVKAKKFVENIVTSVYVHPDSAHVAIVPFSSVVLPGLPLKSGIAPKTVTTFANGVAPRTGQSNVYEALKYLKTDTFTAGNGARPQIPRAVFLITDGQLNPKLRDEIIVQINILTQQNIPINVVTTDTTNIDQDMIDIINYPALAPTDLGTINVNEIVNNVVVNVVKVIQCGPGFKSVNNKCQDINECDRRPSVCLQAGTCKNTVGSYVCQCAADQIYDSHVGCQAKQPIDVVFLVDVSPMSSPAAITKARESIVTMIKKLYINPSFARVAIVTFADASVATLSSLMTTTNYDSVALAVNQITRRGSSSTPIAQVLKHVKDVIKPQFRSNSHKMVFYLTGQVFTSQQNQINTRLIENFKQTESITFIVTSIMPRPSASGPSSSVQQDPLPQPNRIIIYEDTSASTIWGIMIWVIRSINCNRGQYFNNGRCQDINECQYGACGAGVQCTNRAPGFTCSCPSGQIYSPESGCVINKPVDIAFMLDASSAVTREQFQKAVSFVGQSLSKIKISNNAARVLISTIYGVSGNRQSLTLAQLWGRQGDNAYVESTLSQLKYNGGPSKGVLAKILSSAYTLLPAGNRPKIVVVVGAGMYPNDGSVLQGLYDAMGVLNRGIRFFGVTFDKSKAAEMLYSHISYRNLFNPSAAEVTTWISDIIINTQCPNGQVRVGNKCQGLNECQKFKPCGVSSQRVCTDKPIGFACSCKSGVMDPFKICTSSSNSNSVGGSSSFRCISGITQKVYKDGDRWTDVCVNYRCDASQRKAVLESFQCNTGTNAKPVCVANGSTNPRGDQTCTCTATRSGDRISHSLECYYSNNFYASLGR